MRRPLLRAICSYSFSDAGGHESLRIPFRRSSLHGDNADFCGASDDGTELVRSAGRDANHNRTIGDAVGASRAARFSFDGGCAASSAVRI